MSAFVAVLESSAGTREVTVEARGHSAALAAARVLCVGDEFVRGVSQDEAPNAGAGSGVAAMTYAMDTYLTPESGPFACGMVAGAALCSDGKVRKVRFQNGGIADTFFSIPASVKVSGKTVSGYVTVETVEGWTTPTDDDPAVVRFVAYTYGRNGSLLPGVR